MPTIDEALLHAKELLRTGQLAAAESLCRQVQQFAPADPRAWQMLGFVALSSGRLNDADVLLRQAATLDPSQPQTWCQLSIVYRQLARSAEAEKCARRAIALDPNGAGGWARLGECLVDQQRWQEAAEALRKAVELHPRDAAGWLALALAEHSLGRREAGLQAFARAAELRPDDEETISRYALQLLDSGQPSAAADLLRNLLARIPNLPAAWFVLATANEQLGEYEAAEAACWRALELAPGQSAARFALARLLHAQWRSVEAEHLVRQLLADRPDDADAWTLLAHIQQSLSDPDAAIASAQKAQDLAPDPIRHSKLLLASQYAEGVTAASLLPAHREWDEAYAQRWRPLAEPIRTLRPAGQPLRLGFVSSDFGRHPVSYLALRGVECLDRSRFAVTVYFDRHWEDAWTVRWRSAANTWRRVPGWTHDDLTQRIRDDGIDVLFDLSGHVGSRLLVFARRPAPVQIAWLGYPGTTGLAAMDYLLADPYQVPAGEDAEYAEKILRLPHSSVCYTAPHDAPPVAPLPANSAGYVTFGCFNNPAKYSPQILDAWATILRRLPTAKLLLKFGWLGERAVQESLRAKLVQRGVSSEQLLFEGPAPHNEFLGSYGRVDLALDTQPYSGGLTTCEALWMGVPVVTCHGQTFAGRHSVSHLTNAGCPQFIAANLQCYVELAVNWAGRLDELAALRAGLREQVNRSLLYDGPRFARDLEVALTGIAGALASATARTIDPAGSQTPR